MRIRSVSLQHFRSYDALVLAFSDAPLQFLEGPNGSGKTNIVEAMSILSQGRSCLRADHEEIIRFGSDFFKIRAELTNDESEETSVECVYQVSPRKASAYFVKDIKTPLLSFIGVLPTIVFLPQDLDLFTGPPAGRRNFIDALLSQLRPDYAAKRMEFERVLKQRNALLRRIANGEAQESELDLWDVELASAGALIVERRSDALSALGDVLPQELSALGEEWTEFTIGWVDARTGSLQNALLQSLQKYRSRDIILQTTSSGPHRDDWRITTGGRSIAHIASRGQQRAALLALLFVSASLFETVRKEKPVILLDDVLSELDDRHQSALLKRLSGHQVIVTSAHPPQETKGLTVWRVGDGRVSRK